VLAESFRIAFHSIPWQYILLTQKVRQFSLFFESKPGADASLRVVYLGKLPLHFAARMGYLNMVKFLLEKDPSTSSFMSKKLKLPLHFAVGEGHYDISKLLLETYPDGAQVPSHKFKLPIHHAARWGYGEIVEELILTYPEGVRAHDWEGSLPLHDAARGGQTSVARKLIEHYPQGLCTSNLRGEIPLTTAVENNTLPMVQSMVMAWPAGARYVMSNMDEYDDVEGKKWEIINMCLMGAVGCFGNGTTSDENMVLVTFNREDLINRDNDSEGNFLSSITSHEEENINAHAEQSGILDASKSGIIQGGSQAVVSYGISEYRSRCEVVLNGVLMFLPLNAALVCGASLPVLQSVFKRFRYQISRKNPFGDLPLHLAAEFLRGDHDTFVSLLISEYPEACVVRNALGQFPLHVALIKRARYSLVRNLILSNQASALQRFKSNDCYHGMEPLFVATTCGCELSIIHFLLLINPSVLTSV